MLFRSAPIPIVVVFRKVVPYVVQSISSHPLIDTLDIFRFYSKWDAFPCCVVAVADDVVADSASWEEFGYTVGQFGCGHLHFSGVGGPVHRIPVAVCREW